MTTFLRKIQLKILIHVQQIMSFLGRFFFSNRKTLLNNIIHSFKFIQCIETYDTLLNLLNCTPFHSTFSIFSYALLTMHA
ncbi:hypothetical protein CW304_00345 [Bacillus sp. UFRGS-B20]|nr:hypothetical protein CW304_00345 [Bacillus sp. UFRGS-B20]